MGERYRESEREAEIERGAKTMTKPNRRRQEGGVERDMRVCLWGEEVELGLSVIGFRLLLQS